MKGKSNQGKSLFINKSTDNLLETKGSLDQNRQCAQTTPRLIEKNRGKQKKNEKYRGN